MGNYALCMRASRESVTRDIDGVGAPKQIDSFDSKNFKCEFISNEKFNLHTIFIILIEYLVF